VAVRAVRPDESGRHPGPTESGLGTGAGDPERADLAGLYDRHASAVYRLLLAMLGSPEDAQDALSEVFLKTARLDLRLVRRPRAYLLASARNQAISILRRRKREAPVAPSDAVFFDHSRLNLAQALLARRMEAALRELPPEQREVIVLKVYEGLTFAEIAAVTRARPNTVASRYRYAVEKLRRALQE
jgi:RNA polymerase sigma-70 factor (ECF subfamily)